MAPAKEKTTTAAAPGKATTQAALDVEIIKQHPGPVQVQRAVKVMVPGKHFPQLQPSEQKVDYEGTATEYADRHKFEKHGKAWGGAHTGPGIRFVCMSDAIDDPDHRGFWTTLSLWNRWRHHTYKDNTNAELPFLDRLPAAAAKAKAPAASGPKEKEEPEIKKHFKLVSTGTHVTGGSGRYAGKSQPAFYFGCLKPGCKRGVGHPIKQVGKCTGQLFLHLETCQPVLCKQLRVNSPYSPVMIGDDGEEYELYPFEELLPHHALYVSKCFRSLDHFYETRADNGFIEYVRSWDKRAGLPHEQTCQNLLLVYEELVDEKIQKIINKLFELFGAPFCGSTGDMWSLKSCRQSFGCFRGSFVVDGDLLAGLFGVDTYKGKLLKFAPILGFDVFDESRHTGSAIARWKGGVMKAWRLDGGAIGLATEDGASNNVAANRILNQPSKVCLPHNVARAVNYSVGEAGKPSPNPELKAFIGRSSKQASAFSRSVVTNVALQEAQLEANPDLKPNKTLQPKTKNLTRWLGLFEMANRNRRIGKEMRIALTGAENGICVEKQADPVRPMACVSDDDSDADSDSSGEDQEEGNRAAGKQFPLAHRTLSMADYGHSNILESVLHAPREITLGAETGDGGEGLDLGMGYVLLGMMRDLATADTLEIVSGTSKDGDWDEVAAASLPEMFKTQRKVFAKQLTTRFALDSTPDKHTLLALKMHPAINTDKDGPQLAGKQAKGEMMDAEYKRALRRQALLLQHRSATVATDQPTISPAAAQTSDTATAEAGAAAVHAAPPTAAAPAPKKRRGLFGSAVSAQKLQAEPEQALSPIDIAVNAEMEQFELISQKILAKGVDDDYYEGGSRFNLLSFWADHKAALPFHYGVYIAEVGCKLVAASNVETVFSGAGKFMEAGSNTGPKTLKRIIKLHYNWKYSFLQPSLEEVTARYNLKWPRGKASKNVADAAKAAAAAKLVAEAAAANVAEAAKAAAAAKLAAEEAAAASAEANGTATNGTDAVAADGAAAD